MKKTIAVAVIVLSALAFASDGYCQDAARKVSRGVANIVTSPFEIPKTVTTSYCASNCVAESIFIGIPQGIANMVKRLATGVYETVTFPFPIPENYKPIMEPEFLWES